MSNEEKASLWRKWGSVILGGLLLFLIGLEIGAEAMRMKARDTDALVRDAQAKVMEAAATLGDARAQIAAAILSAERLKAGYVNALGMVESLTQQLKEARTVVQPIATAEQSGFTVLYESGRASLNVSLLPFPGAPRIALGPGSQLAPRWIVPGQIQPKMVGETRQAIYYYFDSASNAWTGPFAPLRVTQ